MPKLTQLSWWNFLTLNLLFLLFFCDLSHEGQDPVYTPFCVLGAQHRALHRRWGSANFAVSVGSPADGFLCTKVLPPKAGYTYSTWLGKRAQNGN